MSKFSGVLKKLKSIKHIEIILAVLLGLIILLVYFSSTNTLVHNKVTVSTQIGTYLSEIENKLASLIAQIEGAGRVSVMVMSDENNDNEETPKIVSAVVVASGANNVFVKLEIIKAVEALLGINPQNIEVLAGGQK